MRPVLRRIGQRRRRAAKGHSPRYHAPGVEGTASDRTQASCKASDGAAPSRVRAREIDDPPDPRGGSPGETRRNPSGGLRRTSRVETGGNGAIAITWQTITSARSERLRTLPRPVRAKAACTAPRGYIRAITPMPGSAGRREPPGSDARVRAIPESPNAGEVRLERDRFLRRVLGVDGIAEGARAGLLRLGRQRRARPSARMGGGGAAFPGGCARGEPGTDRRAVAGRSARARTSRHPPREASPQAPRPSSGGSAEPVPPRTRAQRESMRMS